jgi:hypothetical protein
MKDKLKVEARTARQRSRPSGAWLGSRQVLSCEQEGGRWKVEGGRWKVEGGKKNPKTLLERVMLTFV